MNILGTFSKAWKDLKIKVSSTFDAIELDKIAKKTKFIQRSSSLLQGKDFVDLLSAASIDPKIVPLEGLCIALRKLNAETDLTPQSLMERINNPKAVEFLKCVFQQTLEKGIVDIVKKVPPDLLHPFNNVFIEDCTECILNEALQKEFKGSGGETSKSSVKIHLVYEIKQKNIRSIDLVDRKSPDQKLAQKHLSIIKEKDLVIRDLGFFDGEVLKLIDKIKAFFLSRLPAGVYVYINKNDKNPTDLAKYINENFQHSSVIDINVFVTVEKLPCRLIAYRAPQELADKRRREVNKNAQKKGRTPKQEVLNRLDFTFFLTNVPVAVWKAEIVGTVYTVRWQIELIYKNWKSSLHINHLNGINPNRIRCLIYGKLILISVINMIYKLVDWYAQKLGREISLHKVINWLKQENVIRKLMFQCVNFKIMKQLIREIPKTLCKAKRKRKTTQECMEMGISYEYLYGKEKLLQEVPAILSSIGVSTNKAA